MPREKGQNVTSFAVNYTLINIFEELNLENQYVNVKIGNGMAKMELYSIMEFLVRSNISGKTTISKLQFIETLKIYMSKNQPKEKFVQLITSYMSTIKV